MRFRFAPFRTVCALGAIALLVGVGACQQLPELPASEAPPAPEGAEGVAQTFQPITDVPIPEGARLDTDRSLVLGGGDHWTGRLVIAISDSAAEAFGRYARDMPRFGWQHITSVQAEVSILTFARELRVATIQIEGKTLGGSTVTMVMSPRASEADAPSATSPDGAIHAQPIE